MIRRAITGDDMGWEDFSCFGTRDAKNEHVDRLADEGVRFEQFYVNLWADDVHSPFHAPECFPIPRTAGESPRQALQLQFGKRFRNRRPQPEKISNQTA